MTGQSGTLITAHPSGEQDVLPHGNRDPPYDASRPGFPLQPPGNISLTMNRYARTDLAWRLDDVDRTRRYAEMAAPTSTRKKITPAIVRTVSDFNHCTITSP